MPPSLDLNKAIQFVSENGTILEQARLLRILMGVEPSIEAYQKLLDSQNPDGGFPSRPRPGSQSALDSTLTALWQFDELGLWHLTAAQRSMDFLAAMQQPDGGWDENPELPEHDLPPWIRPGEQATRLYLSTYALYWLAVRGKRPLPVFQRGAAYISTQQQPGGRIPGYMHNNWLGAAVFQLGGESYAHNAARSLAYMQSIPFSDWEDSQIAWALECLTRAGLPGEQPFMRAMLAELVRRQAADGSWAAEDGPSFAASATVGALKVLNQHGLIETID
jgi:hypothetical protein